MNAEQPLTLRTVEVDVEATMEVCAIHKRHSPANLTVEMHHVIPVAWQLFFIPEGKTPYPGPDPNGRGELWDARTAALCPTGHRNVHHLIVEAMHAQFAQTGFEPSVRASLTAPKGPQLDMALLALIRFAEAGGNLVLLAAAHEWGQA